VGVAAGVVVGTALAAGIVCVNPELAVTDVAPIALVLSALYAAIHVAALCVAGVSLWLLGVRPGLRVFIGLVVGFWLLLNGAVRHISSLQFLSVTPHLSAIGTLDLVAIAAASALAALGIAIRRYRLVAGAVAIAVALEGIAEWHERAREWDVAREVPKALASRPASPVEATACFEDARLVVLGFDGLSWDVLLPLLERGDLPGFRVLLQDAAYANLGTHRMTKSPLVWETIATGQSPRRHGIGHHAHFEFPGVRERVRQLPYLPLTNSPMMLRRLLSSSRLSGRAWRAVASDSTDAHTARFWEVAQRAGLGVGLYGWMNTTPATPVRPFLHGYGAVQPITFPVDLEANLPPLPDDPGMGSAGLDWLRAKIAYEYAGYQRFRMLALRDHPEVLIYYTHVGDAVNHFNWKQEAHGEGFLISGLRHPDLEPGPTISLVMEFLDGIVTDVLACTPPDATIALMSDHGFDYRGYEHDNAPPGVLILRGPGIQSGAFEEARIYDVAPTLLHVLGLPVARDMEGVPLAVASQGGPLDRPIGWVATHGPALEPLPPQPTDPDAIREHWEYLRALGYVN
jgi:hypothetical protein